MACRECDCKHVEFWRAVCESCGGVVFPATLSRPVERVGGVVAAKLCECRSMGLRATCDDCRGKIHCSGGVRVVTLGNDIPPKVQRVVDAARAWRKRFVDSNSTSYSSFIDELLCSIDALDAPEPRYALGMVVYRENPVDPQAEHTVIDRKGRAFGVRGLPEEARMVVDALNAQEPKP